MLPRLLSRIYDISESSSLKLVSGRHALLKITLFSFALGMLLSFPRYTWLHSAVTREDWAGVIEKRDDPLKDMTKAYPASSHNSKVNFRLVVPLIARAAGLGIVGIYAAQVACSLATLWAVALLTRRITGDDVCGLFFTAGLAATWSGAQGWVEVRACFDAFAVLFLLGAVLSRGPVLAGAFVSLAAWTDERGLIASSLVFLYHCCRRLDAPGPRWRAYVGGPQAGIVVAWAAYLALRAWLAWRYDIATSTGGANLGVLFQQWNIYPIGCWSAFEGAWLLIFTSMAVLAIRRQVAFLGLWATVMLLITLVSCCVYDVTRSMTYLTPGLFIATEVLRKAEDTPALRRLLFAVAAASILFPTYYVHDRWVVDWYPPMPFQVVLMVLGR